MSIWAGGLFGWKVQHLREVSFRWKCLKSLTRNFQETNWRLETSSLFWSNGSGYSCYQPLTQPIKAILRYTLLASWSALFLNYPAFSCYTRKCPRWHFPTELIIIIIRGGCCCLCPLAQPFYFFCMPIDKNDPSFKLSPSQNMSSGGPLSPVIAKFLTCPAQFISVPPSISSKPHLRSQVPPLYLSGIYPSCLNQHKNIKPFSIKIGSITTQPNPDLLYQTIDFS